MQKLTAISVFFLGLSVFFLGYSILEYGKQEESYNKTRNPAAIGVTRSKNEITLRNGNSYDNAIHIKVHD